MATGTVKFFNAGEGPGFIKPHNRGEDGFVNVPPLESGGSPREGDNVSFEIGQDRRAGKSRAARVPVK